jgi:hypothetical protein
MENESVRGAPCTIAWEPIEAEELSAADIAARETAEWIAQRNAQTGDVPESSKVDTECPAWFDVDARGVVVADNFVAPTTDQKVMMDPFYDMWVAGAKK